MRTPVAFNCSILRAPRTGIGQYVAELCSALQAREDFELELFSGWSWGSELAHAPLPGYSRITSLAKSLLPNAYALRRKFEQRSFTQGVRRLKPALYHEPSLWPFDFDGPMVMTLHDLTHVHYPHTQPADRLREINRQVHKALERAGRILVDSQYIANEVRQHYGVKECQLVVAPLGYAARFHPRSHDELSKTLQFFNVRASQYFICVGTLEPRKNLQSALAGYLGLPEHIRKHFPLLIVGMPGWHTSQLQGSLQKALASNQVRLLGYQPDDTVAELLAGARLLLFPSLYEGFGLPVLEAMASGTPVILSRRAALPELAGSAGIYIEPHDEKDFTQALLRFIDDDREWQLKRQIGLAQALKFSWSRCAQITAATYFDLLES